MMGVELVKSGGKFILTRVDLFVSETVRVLKGRGTPLVAGQFREGVRSDAGGGGVVEQPAKKINAQKTLPVILNTRLLCGTQKRTQVVLRRDIHLRLLFQFDSNGNYDKIVMYAGCSQIPGELAQTFFESRARQKFDGRKKSF